MRFFKKRPKPLVEIDEENIKHLPAARLLRLILQTAADDGAQAVVFGVPQDVTWDWDAAETEAKQRAAIIEAAVRPDLPDPNVSLPPSLSKDSTLPPADRITDVPVFLQKNGEYLAIVPIPVYVYPDLWWAFKLMQVSLDTNTNTSPTYIELESNHPNTRRFIQVQTAVARDNTQRIQLGDLRTEPATLPAKHVC